MQYSTTASPSGYMTGGVRSGVRTTAATCWGVALTVSDSSTLRLTSCTGRSWGSSGGREYPSSRNTSSGVHPEETASMSSFSPSMRCRPRVLRSFACKSARACLMRSLLRAVITTAIQRDTSFAIG